MPRAASPNAAARIKLLWRSPANTTTWEQSHRVESQRILPVRSRRRLKTLPNSRCREQVSDGYDEPLMHTMYVDKTSGCSPCGALSRLSRAHPAKRHFVLGFANDADDIKRAFGIAPRCSLKRRAKTSCTISSRPRRDGYTEQVKFVQLYLDGADVDQLHPLLDTSVHEYVELG